MGALQSEWVMKWLRGIAVALASLAGPALADPVNVFQINPNGAFLRTSGEYALAAPLVIDLQALGNGPGDVLHLKLRGDMALTVFADVDPFNAQDIFDFVGGVFSSSATLLGADQLNRVAGAIGTGLPALSSDPTLMGNLPTDIAEDFQILDTYVYLPAAARYLFVAVSDIFYSDNIDPDQDLALEVSIPEPATASVLAGLAFALLMRRRIHARG